MKKGAIIFYITICWFGTLHAQQHVGFNHLTGTANVSIPLYTVGSVPIGLNYSARGIRVRQVAGLVGLGWNLNAGGSIVREVKGLPDDTPTSGWLNNNAGSLIDTFSDDPSADCYGDSLQNVNIFKINSKLDTEPDIFYINTPFVSGRFVFNTKTLNQIKPEMQPYQDLQIEYAVEDDKISSFTLTDDHGVIYEFAVVDQSTKSVVFEKRDVFFKRLQAQTSDSVQNDAWHLSQITMPNGQYIRLDYKKVASTDRLVEKSSDDGIPRNFLYAGSSHGAFGISHQIEQKHLLKSITSSNGESVKFIFTTLNDGVIENRLLRIERYSHSELTSSYDFYYKDVYPENFQTWNPTYDAKQYEKRTFLASINPRHNGKVYTGYKFDYHGIYDYYNKMPSHKSSAIDIYGFYKKDKIIGQGQSEIYYNPALPEGEQYRLEPLTAFHPHKAYEIVQIRELIPTVYYNPTLDGSNQYRVEPLPSGHPNKGSEIAMPGNDRSVDESGLHYGSLSKLTYPTGGNTRFFYEANKYFDPTANSEYYGAGLRLQKTIVHDGVSNTNNVVTNYTYADALNPLATSGVIVERPTYAFGTTFRAEMDSTVLTDMTFSLVILNDSTFQHTGEFTSDTTHLIPAMTFNEIQSDYTLSDLDKAKLLSIRTNFDLSSGNNSVLYKRVGISRPGSGQRIFNFDIPAVLDDTTANNGQWAPTQMGVARTNSALGCYETGRFVTNGANIYPFADNPNYNFQRGLLNSVQAFNENGDPVTETAYEYIQTIPSGADTTIHGIVIDKIPAYHRSTLVITGPSSPGEFYAFGKYKVFSNIRNVRSKAIQTLYDPTDITRKIVTIQDFEYDSEHTRLAETSTTKSDGTIARSYTQYVDDYDTSSPLDTASIMLDSLQAKHQNGLVVESYSTIQAPGAAETIVSGSIVSFDNFGKNVVHPHRQYVLNKRATIDKSNFTTSAINGGIFIKDNDYQLVQTIQDYDINEKVSNVIGRSKIRSGIHWGYLNNQALVEISNAGAENVLYSGFDEDTGFDFEYPIESTSPNHYTPKSGPGALWMEAAGGNVLSGEIVKDVKTKRLVLSFWAHTSNSGIMTWELKNQDGSSTLRTGDMNYSFSLQWRYYETVLDVADLIGPFQLTLVNDTDVHVDEVLLYPEEATISYRSIGKKGELLSESIAGKTTTYYEYDELFRNTLVRDDDKNILSKTEYSDVEITPPVEYDFLYKGINLDGEAVFEFINPEIIGDSTFVWSFGDDGYGIEMTGQNFITHAYSEPGVYTVFLFIYGDIYTNLSQTILVEDFPQADICATGPQVIDQCLSTAISIFQDGCYPSNNYQVLPTIFRVGELINCADCESQTITYSWQVQHAGTNTWNEVGTGESIARLYDNTYTMRCMLTVGTTNPVTITSNTKTVTVYKSDPSCPDFPVN